MPFFYTLQHSQACSNRAKQQLAPFLLLSMLVPSALAAQTQNKPNNPACEITILTTVAPVVATDCDQSNEESVDWEEPTATVSTGCGPINIVQTAGPTRGTDALIGEYDIDYTFMAVDKTTLKVIQKTTTNHLSVVPNDTSPPVIAPIGAQNIQGNKVPNLTTALTVSDNCTAKTDLRIEQTPTTGTIINTPTQVKISAIDQAGNEAHIMVLVTPR